MRIKMPIFIPISALMILLSGCSPILVTFDDRVPAQTLSYIGAPSVSDGRGRFRAIFCELLNQRLQDHNRQVACDNYLWRLVDEPQSDEIPAILPAHDSNIVVLLVPGAFSECVGDIGMPYREPAERLRELGYRIKNIAVSGLSSSRKNAGIIAKAVADEPINPNERLVLLGYSKGTTDILHFLVNYPDLASKVSAVLSVAGAVNGSPLADRYYRTKYDNWLAKLPLGKCDPGDGGVFDSLSRRTQIQWLATHPLPRQVSYFSLGSFARSEDIQLIHRYTHKMLRKIDPYSDGQLLMIDQLIPGSVLLGYANSDHWTVAISLEEKYIANNSEMLERGRVLRDVLFEAMILFVTERLNNTALEE